MCRVPVVEIGMERIIIVGAVTLILIWLMISTTRHSAIVKEGRHCLQPSTGLKIFSILIVPLTLFILYAILQSYEGQEIPAFLVGVLFLFASVFLPYHTLFVKLCFDDANVYYKTPFSNKQSSWKNLQEIGHSSLLQTDYFIMDGIGKIWCSELMHGHDELGEILAKKAEEINNSF